MKHSLLILVSAILLTSCAGNQELSGAFSKRKYTKGFFNNSPGSPATVSANNRHETEVNSPYETSATAVPVRPIAPTPVNYSTANKFADNALPGKQAHKTVLIQQKQNPTVSTGNKKIESVRGTEAEKTSANTAHTESAGKAILSWLIMLIVLAGIGFAIAAISHFTLTVLIISLIELGVLLGLLILIFIVALIIVLAKGKSSSKGSGIHE